MYFLPDPQGQGSFLPIFFVIILLGSAACLFVLSILFSLTSLILNRVFKNYGPIGLKRETKYIIQYLDFLLNKLKHILSLKGKQLPHYRPDHDHELYKLYFALMYYFRYYRHYGRRKIVNPNQLSFGF